MAEIWKRPIIAYKPESTAICGNIVMARMTYSVGDLPL